MIFIFTVENALNSRCNHLPKNDSNSWFLVKDKKTTAQKNKPPRGLPKQSTKVSNKESNSVNLRSKFNLNRQENLLRQKNRQSYEKKTNKQSYGKETAKQTNRQSSVLTAYRQCRESDQWEKYICIQVINFV